MKKYKFKPCRKFSKCRHCIHADNCDTYEDKLHYEIFDEIYTALMCEHFELEEVKRNVVSNSKQS